MEINISRNIPRKLQISSHLLAKLRLQLVKGVRGENAVAQLWATGISISFELATVASGPKAHDTTTRTQESN